MFAQRRQRVLEVMGPDAVAILLGARLATRSNDTQYPFRQDSDFLYLTGFDHPNAAAVLRTDGGPELTLFVEPRDRAKEIWNGYRPGLEGALDGYGANEAHPIAELPARIPGLIEPAKRLFHALGRDPALDAAIVAALDEQRMRSRQGVVPASEIVDPRAIVHEMRIIKDDTEIGRMERAAEITCSAHEAAARLARDGTYEYELAAVLDYTFRRLGGSGPAYTTIVGGGSNATVLHYITNDQPLRDGELVLIDSGCEFQGYASDVTRTYPVGGRFTGPRRAVYEVVLEAQRAGLEAAKPGATLTAVHDAAVRRLVEGIVSLGLLSGTIDDLVERGDYHRYYMHRTSHWLGLDVHDVGVYTVDGRPRPLEPGMCFTVEPGLYIASDDESADEQFRGIGVRIEDDVLVTPDGHRNLTAAIPKDIDQVEAWVNGT